MSTAQQAIEAAILCQFLTEAGLPITTFYDDPDNLLLLEAAGGSEIRMIINQQERARNV